MDKYLIINADDFGLSASVNKGVLEAHRLGTVTSATIMANMPGFEDAVQLALQNPTLGIGLHFNLIYGSPVAPLDKVSSLIDSEGNFSGKVRAWRRWEVMLELEAQWEKVKSTGLSLTHLDSHQDTHCRSRKVARAMGTIARREHIFMRQGRPPLLKRYPKTSEHFIGDVYFKEKGLLNLISYFDSLKPGVTELMCHPGYVDEDVKKLSTWTYVREAELRVFTNPEVPKALMSRKINLIHYGHRIKIKNRGV